MSEHRSRRRSGGRSARHAAQRANGIWKRMLADYEPPPLDAAVDEALLDFMERRKAELPDTSS